MTAIKGKRRWDRRGRKLPFLLGGIGVCILLAFFFPHGFIMMMIGIFLALLIVFLFC
ncbi:MAG: hypothetical protein LBR72_03070 [Oscillospiraceae bacterium]|nr:hypothetical protein [Oscillospiraceae bacterium]